MSFFIRTGILALIIFCLSPSNTLAARLYIDPEDTHAMVGDNIGITVRLDTQGQNINVVDGTLSLSYTPNALAVSAISISDSVLPLWPRKPSVSSDNTEISFVGGVPKGTTASDAVLFTIYVDVKKSGQLRLVPRDLKVFLNDGVGTSQIVSADGVVVTITSSPTTYQPHNAWQSMVSNDHTPPHPFTIVASKDLTLFEGKTFLEFYAVDNESGVAYYQVQEGSLPPVRSGSVYVLQQPERADNVVIVTAVDVAGNARQAVYNPAVPSSQSHSVLLISVVVLFVFILGILIVLRKWFYITKEN